MEYTVGMKLWWQSYYKYEAPELVEVVGLRKRGHAKLSNGWVVDEDGIAEGTDREPGGAVRELTEH